MIPISSKPIRPKVDVLNQLCSCFTTKEISEMCGVTVSDVLAWKREDNITKNYEHTERGRE